MSGNINDASREDREGKRDGRPSVFPHAQRSSSSREDKKQGFFETAAKKIVSFISFIPRFISSFMEEFTEPGGGGAIFLGSMIFIVGVVMSSDSYWQMLGGLPLLPFFEQSWLGWRWLPGITLFPPQVWLGILLNITFLIALSFSCITQILQSYFFNGDAKKIAGQTGLNPRTVGLVAIATFTLEFILTFYSRNPLRYDEPSQVLGCVLYNLISIVAAESGRTVYKLLKG